MFQRNKEAILTVEQAYIFALQKFSYREYSQKDLEEKLRLRGCPSGVIAEVIEKCKHYKFLNEEEFAQGVYRRWLAKKYYGRAHLRMELAKKKVADHLVPLILEQLTKETEVYRARAFVADSKQKKPSKYSCENEKSCTIIARALVARGFGSDVISEILCENGYR